MGQAGWLIPVAGILVGGGGVGTILGWLVQRRQAAMVNNASLVGHAIDGLSKLADERREDLEDVRAENADLKKRVAELERQLRRKMT